MTCPTCAPELTTARTRIAQLESELRRCRERVAIMYGKVSVVLDLVNGELERKAAADG